MQVRSNSLQNEREATLLSGQAIQQQSSHSELPFQSSPPHTQKTIRTLKILILLCFALLLATAGYVWKINHELYGQLELLRQQNAMESKEVTENYQYFETKLSNLTLVLDRIKLEILKTSLQAYKGINQISNLNSKTKKQKAQLQSYLQQFQQGFQNVKKRYISEIMSVKHSLRSVGVLPKVIWFYTEFNFSSQKMMEQLLGNFIIEKAKESEFEIRFVNAWTAYQWLSNATISRITKTMQNRKFEQNVNQLLKLALLMQHGGVVMRISQCLMIGNFDFLTSHFKLREQQNGLFTNQVLLFAQFTKDQPRPAYQDYFIAAVAHSSLIVDAFDDLCDIISTGDMKYRAVKEAATIRDEVLSTYVPYIVQHIIQALVEAYTPAYYSLHSINVEVTKFVRPQCRQRLPHLLKRPDWEYIPECGRPVHILHISDRIDRPRFQEQLQHQLTHQDLGADQHGYWHTWMVIRQNRKLFDPLPPRTVSFCILDAHPNTQYRTLVTAFEKLKRQTYKDYAAVYFVEELTQQLENYVKQQRAQGFNLMLELDSGSVGRNYEVGIVKRCPSKSFVFVVRRNQNLADAEALSVLSNTLAPRGILGAFVGLNLTGKVVFSGDTYGGYNKQQYNGRSPRVGDLQNIVNHLRVFHSDCYKLIPQFNLRTHKGVYFNDRLTFLEHFLYMVQNNTAKHDDSEVAHQQRVKWFIKSNSHIFDVPTRILSSHNVIVNTNAWDTLTSHQLQLNYYKTQPYSMTLNMDHLVQNRISMQEFAVFNPALEYEPYTQRAKPQLIPKVFHLIWIDGEMPEVKRKVLELNKLKYPDFEFKIWSKHNITKERFPLSYDLLQTIYNMQETSRFSKRATMADVFRHELLYNQGGIYMDTSMILFNDQLSKWLSYKFFLATERTYRHRWAQSMCIFGVMPKFQGLWRIISHNNTNHYNLYLRDALEIAGPHNFRWTVRGMEEYDPDYLIMDYDTFYPMSYDMDNYQENFCLIQPVFLNRTQEIYYRHGNRVMPKDCGKHYPHSFGKEINNIGGSWQWPKW